MDLFEALKLKKACREYTREQVAQTDVDKLVYALGRAPTASNDPIGIASWWTTRGNQGNQTNLTISYCRPTLVDSYIY